MMKKKNINVKPSRMIFNICNYGIFGLFSFMCIYPLWYIFIYAISDPMRIRSEEVFLYPLGFSLSNIKEILQIGGLGRALLVSVTRTVLGTCITVFICMLLGYIFSKERFPARKLFYRMLIITMYLNGGMIPTYLVYKSYGLVNNFWVYIIPNMISAYYIILIKTYVEQIPLALEESARIDGAGYITVLRCIIFPMSKPIVATIAVYSAVFQWNSWFDNHIYAFGNKKIMTLQYMLYKYLQEAERLMEQMANSSAEIDISNLLTPFGVRMTITLVTMIPIMLVYPFLQRYIIKGIMIGSVKG